MRHFGAKPSHRLAVLLAVAYLVALAFIVLWPTPVDRPVDGLLVKVINRLHGAGVPDWLVNYGTVEFSANIALFVPFGVMVALRLAPRRWWLAPVAAAAVSGVIELAQGLLLPDRVAAWSDVAANTAGGLIGALTVAAVRQALRRRPIDVRDNHLPNRRNVT